MGAQEFSAEQLRRDIATLRGAGLSPKVLQLLLGVGRTSLWRWETGACVPDLAKCLTVHRYAETVGALKRGAAVNEWKTDGMAPACSLSRHLTECLYALTAAGLSPRQICDAVGTSRSTLYNWYRGGVPSGEHGYALMALAEQHGIDTSTMVLRGGG